MRGGRPDQHILDKALMVKREAEAEAAKEVPIHERVDIMEAAPDKARKQTEKR